MLLLTYDSYTIFEQHYSYIIYYCFHDIFCSKFNHPQEQTDLSTKIFCTKLSKIYPLTITVT